MVIPKMSKDIAFKDCHDAYPSLIVLFSSDLAVLYFLNRDLAYPNIAARPIRILFKSSEGT